MEQNEELVTFECVRNDEQNMWLLTVLVNGEARESGCFERTSDLMKAMRYWVNAVETMNEDGSSK